MGVVKPRFTEEEVWKLLPRFCSQHISRCLMKCHDDVVTKNFCLRHLLMWRRCNDDSHKHSNHSSTSVKGTLYTCTTNVDMNLCTKCLGWYNTTINSRLEWICLLLEGKGRLVSCRCWIFYHIFTSGRFRPGCGVLRHTHWDMEANDGILWTALVTWYFWHHFMLVVVSALAAD